MWGQEYLSKKVTSVMNPSVTLFVKYLNNSSNLFLTASGEGRSTHASTDRRDLQQLK